MTTAHLPILVVVLPLFAAPLCMLLPRRSFLWPFAVLVSLATFVIAVLLMIEVYEHGVLRYAIGNWPAPIGIEYRIDALNAIVLLLVSGISAVVLAASRRSIALEIPEKRLSLFYATSLLAVTGLLGMTATGDAFNVFVFLEISALSSYALIAMGSQREALSASFRYLTMGTIGGTFFLLGVGLLYMMTGTLNMEDLAVRLQPVLGTRTVFAALAFVVVGLSIKMALFPLHSWLPNAYTFAPSSVSAFLAGTATKVALYVMLRFVFDIFGVELSLNTMHLDRVLFVISLVAILYGSIAALFQTNIKRLLAYSSIAQIAYMTLAVSFASEAGLQAAVLHLFNHGLIKACLFLTLAALCFRLHSSDLADMKGMGKKMPWTMAAFVVGGLSLIGVPLTAGFISKWYLIQAAMDRQLWLVVVLVLVSSLIAVMYIWKVVEVAYFQNADEDTPKDNSPIHSVQEAPASILVPTYVLVLANLYFGIHSSLTIEIGRRAAGVLMGGFQ